VLAEDIRGRGARGKVERAVSSNVEPRRQHWKLIEAVGGDGRRQLGVRDERHLP
jgi:hypothetical protein